MGTATVFKLPIGFSQKELFGRDDLDFDDADRLSKIVDDVRKRVARIKGEIYEIGRALTEAKSILGHGKFIEYFRANFEFSYATANNFMNVYKHCIGNPELVQTIKPSVLYKITSPKFPKDLRQFLFENYHRLDDIDNERINRVCRLYKDGYVDLKSPEVQCLLQYEKDELEYAEFMQGVDKFIETFEKMYINVLFKIKEAPEWPTPDRDSNKVLGLAKCHAVKLEELYGLLIRAIGSVMPKEYVAVDDKELKPKVFEHCKYPRFFERGEEVPESSIKTNPNWGKPLAPYVRSHFLQFSKKPPKKFGKIKPGSWFEPDEKSRKGSPPPRPVTRRKN